LSNKKMPSASYAYFLNAIGAACWWLATGFASAQASEPFPSIRILGFVAPPTNSCTVPYAELDVVANGNANTSDTFVIVVNGVERYRWGGETMVWANPPGPNIYSIVGDALNLPANTMLTAIVTTYDSANPSSAVVYAGNAVTSSQISWNCTSGQLVGGISNLDLRPKSVPALPIPSAALLLAALLACGVWRAGRTGKSLA
jgi:hypothetical protein